MLIAAFGCSLNVYSLEKKIKLFKSFSENEHPIINFALK